MRQAINSCIIIIFLVKCSFSSPTHKHVLKHTYTYTYTCKLTGYATHSLSFTRSHLYTYTQSLLHKHTKSHTLIQTHTNIHKRTNTHTHTHTHTHTIGSCREGGLKLMLCTTAFSKNSGVLSGVDDVYGNIALCAKLPGLTSSGECGREKACRFGYSCDSLRLHRRRQPRRGSSSGRTAWESSLFAVLHTEQACPRERTHLEASQVAPLAGLAAAI